jgi:hypothetical protein
MVYDPSFTVVGWKQAAACVDAGDQDLHHAAHPRQALHLVRTLSSLLLQPYLEKG